MTPQEREIIAGLFDKVKGAGTAPRDPEADRFIADQLAANPGAPYAMAQTIYAQDQMMQQMHAALEDLQRQVHELSSRPQQGGGFLSSLFGGSRPAAPAQPSYGRGPMGAPAQPAFGQQAGYGQQASPWGQRGAAPAGGGFMAGAMSTAMGVAGGMLLANAVMGAFAGDEAQAAEAPPEDTGLDDAGADMGGEEF